MIYPIPIKNIESLSANFPIFYINPKSGAKDDYMKALNPVITYLSNGTFKDGDIINSTIAFTQETQFNPQPYISHDKIYVSVYDTRN